MIVENPCQFVRVYLVLLSQTTVDWDVEYHQNDSIRMVYVSI